MWLQRGTGGVLLACALSASITTRAAPGDTHPLPAEATSGGSEPTGVMIPEGASWPNRGLGYPYPVPAYPGYGPPPGGGWGYRRGYSEKPPAYREYRRRGGGYRQHRQYANPPLFPLPRQQDERSPSARDAGTGTLPGPPQTSENAP
jgi:hypothetical protein